MDALRNKCVSAKPFKDGSSKTPISPAKMSAINIEYRNRIYRQEKKISSDEFAARLEQKVVNQSLSRAIHNIRTKIAKQSSSKVHKEEECDLEEYELFVVDETDTV